MASELALLAPIEIGDWAEDEDFGIHPYGTKAKRTLLCPDDPGNPLLIEGHRYLFKQAEAWKGQQMWSEAIAYQLGAERGLPVPPCFIATDSQRGTTGALIEFFYGYPDQERSDRLEHGADLLQGAGLMDGRGQPHALSINLRFCEDAGIAGVRDWWASVLAFDTLIGNTDRHSQNWGWLVAADGGIRMAPMFDNGTSLAYQTSDGAIEAGVSAETLDRFVRRGRHSCDWSPDDNTAFNHVGLSQRFAAAYPGSAGAMRQAVSISDNVLEGFLQACTAIEIEPRFNEGRAEMVSGLVRRRRNLLLDALGQFE